MQKKIFLALTVLVFATGSLFLNLNKANANNLTYIDQLPVVTVSGDNHVKLDTFKITMAGTEDYDPSSISGGVGDKKRLFARYKKNGDSVYKKGNGDCTVSTADQIVCYIDKDDAVISETDAPSTPAHGLDPGMYNYSVGSLPNTNPINVNSPNWKDYFNGDQTLTVSDAGIIADVPPSVPNQYGCISTGNNTYCMLSPLPGIGDTHGKIDVTTGLQGYIKGIIVLFMGIIGVLAVLMVVVGGIEYMSTVNIGEKEGAKTRIMNALVGLMLALSSYVILNTINPDLVNLKIHIPQVTIAGGMNTNTAFHTSSNTPPAGSKAMCAPLEPGDMPGGLCDGGNNNAQCVTYAGMIDDVVNTSFSSNTELKKILKINMVEESGCYYNKDAFDGKSYGLFQQTPGDFGQYSSACGGPSSIDAMWLKNSANIKTEICMQAKFILYLEGPDGCGTDIRNIGAGLGGGPAACQPSSNCSTTDTPSPICANPTKIMRYECLWDDSAHTVPNTGYNYARYAAKKMYYCYGNGSGWYN